MTTGKLLGVALLASASLITVSALAEPVADGGRKFTTTLSGANECNAGGTCNLGDPDGSGTASITVNVGQRRVCWDIDTSNLGTITRGHIHKAPAGTAGAIVVGFFEATAVDLHGCTTTDVDRALLIDIIQHPSSYYVNVHTSDFPAGAIRGQLSK
ncbi:MAG TPA: CHRD domain-containing protein [Sphingomicrobium sp.]|jgi:hypothetical protein|nr:CHRD domain-containing protein [Sphingomicrobium sp.]